MPKPGSEIKTNAKATASKKRKAHPIEEDKENEDSSATHPAAHPSNKKSNRKENATPPPADSTREPSANTPGRVGPIRRTSFSVEPDIKPFKGPPGKKVRKTYQEKQDEYAQFALENEGHCFHA